MSSDCYKNEPVVSIIIITWNCRAHVLQCLKSIYASRGATFEIIVYDNGSRDGTPNAIRVNYPEVRMLENSGNAGFAAANNEALKHARGRYLLMLNPDTEILPSTLKKFIAAAGKHADRALLAPLLLNQDGAMQPSWHAFPTLSGFAKKGVAIFKNFLKSNSAQKAREVDWAIGACWFLPRKIYDAAGELDAFLFMYGEDLDYCWRLRRAGFKIIGVPTLRIKHHGNVSGQQKWGDRRRFKIQQGAVYFWKKHFGTYYVFIMTPSCISYYLWQDAGRLLKAAFGRKKGNADPQWRHGVALIKACLTQTGARL